MPVSFNSNAMCATSGAGTDYISAEPESNPICFLWDSCCSIFSFLSSVLQIIVCPFVFLLDIVLTSVFRFTASDYIYPL